MKTKKNYADKNSDPKKRDSVKEKAENTHKSNKLHGSITGAKTQRSTATKGSHSKSQAKHKSKTSKDEANLMLIVNDFKKGLGGF